MNMDAFRQSGVSYISLQNHSKIKAEIDVKAQRVSEGETFPTTTHPPPLPHHPHASSSLLLVALVGHLTHTATKAEEKALCSPVASFLQTTQSHQVAQDPSGKENRDHSGQMRFLFSGEGCCWGDR